MAEGFKQKPITTYLISGVWTDHQNRVSHYAVHQFLDPGVSSAKKLTRKEVLILIEFGKFLYTWQWDYEKGRFDTGQAVHVYEGNEGRILWTLPMEDRTKHLKHLIKIDWFEPVAKIPSSQG